MFELSKRDPLLTFDKPHFQVKLHSDLLEVDLKEGAKKKLEDLAESHPALRDSMGWIFQTIIPLDVKLHEIEKVEDHNGKVHLQIPHRRDISIPLDPLEGATLVEKLNELIPVEKQRMQELHQAGLVASKEKERYRTEFKAAGRRR